MKPEVNFLDQIKLLHMYCLIWDPFWDFHREVKLGVNHYTVTEIIAKICNTKHLGSFRRLATTW